MEIGKRMEGWNEGKRQKSSQADEAALASRSDKKLKGQQCAKHIVEP